MRKHKIIEIILVIILFDSIAFTHPALAEETPKSLVEAILTCTFDSDTHLTVQAHMIVNSINVFDTVYNRQEIENMATTNQYVMGAIMLRLHESVKTQVQTAFTDAEIDTINTMPSYEKPYFIDDFQVNLTSAFFKYNGSLNLTEFIPGVLDIGATAAYNFNLQAESGWNTTYIYTLPSFMTLAYANTIDTEPSSNKVKWEIRNWHGNDTGIKAIISVQSKNPTTKPLGTEDISLEYILDTRTINDISFIDSILIKRINLGPYNVLPEFITGLENIPADGVRLFIKLGLFSWEDLFQNTIQPVQQQIVSLMKNSSIDQNLNLSFSWDIESTTNCSMPYNITHMDDAPAIRANFKDSNVNLKICQMPARAFFGLINTGATAVISSTDINFGNGLENSMYPYNILLYLPSNISLDEKNLYTWNETKPFSGVFTSQMKPEPPYSKEHTETLIEIELLKMDLNIPSIITGKTELTTSVKLKEDDRLYVINRSKEFTFSPKINITYLNADAFRLCTEENVFTQNQIDIFLSQKKDVFQQRLSEIFHGMSVKGTIDWKLFSNSLVWDKDISTMDDITPIVISNYANEVYTVGFNVSVWPMELMITPQRFAFHGLENQTVTYRIVFPRGIAINATESIGKPIITGKTNDGQDYIELSYDGESTTEPTILTCTLNASPIFILGLFLPCFLVFILLIVLITIIYLIRKKRGGLRRGKRKLFEPEDNEPSEYDGEEYYVPPPPSSRKKKK